MNLKVPLFFFYPFLITADDLGENEHFVGALKMQNLPQEERVGSFADLKNPQPGRNTPESPRADSAA
jgi:hypothetical protein